MGRFLNTVYRDSVNNLTGFQDQLLQNPMYVFNDRSATPVRYWNINTDQSSIDEGSGLIMNEVGSQSPLRFNIIEDLLLFGIPKIELNLDNGEFGLEAEAITGEAYIMPNTIVPIQGDFFEIPYMYDKPWLFQVTEVQRDTFDTGATVYKISYKLERHEDKQIEKNVVEEFIAVESTAGTNIKTVVKKSNYVKASKLEELAATLKKYYKDLFFVESVQTFIYKYLNDYSLYDPFMIEFLLRNRVLESSYSDYVYISQAIPIPQTFSIDYDRTFFRAFELKDKHKLETCNISAQAMMITTFATVFHSRFEPYFELKYKYIKPKEKMGLNNFIETFPYDLIYDIIDNRIIESDDDNSRYLYKNIFIKYFNDTPLSAEDVDSVNEIVYDDSKEIFYMLPLLIFVIERYTQDLLN